MNLRLRDLRQDLDLKQEDVAEFLNCRQQTYSRYETGAAQPSLEILVKLALFFDTSTDFILNLTEEEKPYPRKKGLPKYKYIKEK